VIEGLNSQPACSSQPGSEVFETREIKQGLSQGFQLLQWQSLDAGGSGVGQGGPHRRLSWRKVNFASPRASPWASPSWRPSSVHCWAARRIHHVASWKHGVMGSDLPWVLVIEAQR
jgi:hypothetical protein